MSRILVIAAICAILGGFAIAAQGGINGALGKRLEHPLHASVISFTVGLISILLICLLWTRSLPVPSTVLRSPWWTLIGGTLGCVVVTTSLLIVPRVGATVWLGLFVCSQFAAALILDHFGWVGLPVQTITLGKLAGVIAMLFGVLLVLRG